MSSTKRFCDKTMDRISELPRNLINCILERMLIRDAVRTSILSRKWRYIWASVAQIVFDEHFFIEIYKKSQQFICYKFPKAISTVFFVHNDPILRFILYIPNLFCDFSPEIDNWMLSLSRNGLKELQLRNANQTVPYILPSCIFLCNTLRLLIVDNCTLKPPSVFEGFHYLVHLDLVNVSLSSNMSTKILHKGPMLRTLGFYYCTGVELQNINTPNLSRFVMKKSEKVDWQWFERNQQLTFVHLELCKKVESVRQTVNVIILLKNIPRLRFLGMNGFSLKFLAPGDSARSLPTFRALFLKYLHLQDFGVDDVDQISSAICLLRNCPNLKTLNINFTPSEENVTGPFLSYLESSNHKDMKLERLETVYIRFVKGLKAQLLFIKLLLACSTCLRWMIIEQSKSIGVSDGFNISKEVLRCSRASSRAEIIYV